MKLNYITSGTGKPVLILHGLFGSTDNWTYISSQLSKDFTIVRLDLRNHGNSPRDDVFTYDAMANDVLNLIAEDIQEPVGIIGHSLGGKVAMTAADIAPDWIDRLIIVDISVRSYSPHYFDDVLSAMHSVDQQCFTNRQDVRKYLETTTLSKSMQGFLVKSLQEKEGERGAWKFNLEAIQKGIPDLSKRIPLTQVFTKPALFLYGEASDFIQPSDFPEILRHFPKAQWKGIPHATHWVHVDAPKQFVESATHFLKG